MKIKPLQNESEEVFVSRFMQDDSIQADYPDAKQRSAAAYAVWRERGADVNVNAGDVKCPNPSCSRTFSDQGELQRHLIGAHGESREIAAARAAGAFDPGYGSRNSGDWPSRVDFDFIEPGLVHYQDKGTVLVRKAVLDKMRNTMEGKPITNDHQNVRPTDYKDGKASGLVASTMQNATTGMDCGTGFVWDPEVKRMIRNGYKVSCSYTVKKWGPGGVHNNIPYAAEVLEGEYDHLAIVEDPRYEGVSIKMHNSIGGKTMNLLKFFKKDNVESSVEIDAEKTKVTVADGKDVSLSELVALHNSREAELKNKLDDDTMIDVGGGKKVSVKDLKSGYVAKNAADDEEEEKKKKADKDKAENDAAEEMDKKHKDGDHEKADMKNCKMCNAAREVKNARERERLDNAAAVRSGKIDKPGFKAPGSGLALGAEKYGSVKKS